jgi:hypothetical protein
MAFKGLTQMILVIRPRLEKVPRQLLLPVEDKWNSLNTENAFENKIFH